MGNCQLKEALFRAVESGDVEATHVVLGKMGPHADLTFRQPPDQNTPLHLACIVGHEAVIQLLLSWPNQPGSKDADGGVATGAVDGGESGTPSDSLVHCVDIHGRSALYVASMGGHLACVRLLLAHGARVNGASKEGRTPLFVACWRNRGEVARTLLEHGGDLAVRDEEGKTCWSVAREWSHFELADEMEARAREKGILTAAATPVPATAAAAAPITPDAQPISAPSTNDNTHPHGQVPPLDTQTPPPSTQAVASESLVLDIQVEA